MPNQLLNKKMTDKYFPNFFNRCYLLFTLCPSYCI